MDQPIIPPEEMKQLLEENYSLINPEKITKIEKVTGIEKNSHNYIVFTQDKKYLARRHLALSKENAEKVLKIIDFCAKQGIKVPTVIKNNKQELVTAKGKEHFTVFEFIEGSEYNGSSEQLNSLAKEVARLHQALRTYTENLPCTENSIYDELLYSNLTEEELLEISRLSAPEISPEDISVIKNEMIEISKVSSDLQKYKTANLLISQPIHRDLHVKNVLFQNNEVAAILDFDAIKIGLRIVDVGFCGHRFAGSKILHFIKEYDQFNPLTPEEKKMIIFIVREEFLRRANYILRDLLTGRKTWLSSFSSHLQAIRLLRQL